LALSTTIKSIQDIMRKDVGVDGDAQRIGQLVWLLFLKIWDDREQELELMEDDYASPLIGLTWRENGEVKKASDLRWRAWAADPEGMTGDTLLEFVNNTLFSALKGMEVGPAASGDDAAALAVNSLRSRRLLVRSVFEDAYQYMKSGTLLRQVINKMQADIDFNDATNRHLFGDIYEQILKGLQSAGNAGEYYTPRAVTQFAVDMVNPRLGETILDPACGTGGFLACAIEHVRRNEVQTPEQERLLQVSVRGVEKKPLPHLLCTTNMIVHGIDVPTGIVRDNTLSRPLRDISARDRIDVVITNPPFGGMEEDGIENNFPTDFRTRETADLFLVLIAELLKPGGRAAVVLPDGTLFGEGVKTRIKERLLTECNLHTIVRLPKGVFAPYTSIKTNVLFFEKGKPTTDVWYYEHPYPPGYKSYSKTKPMRIEEFEPEKAWWTDRKESESAWRVGIDQIRERGFNLDITNPNAPGISHHDPDELLARYDKEVAATAALREELRRVLWAALAGRSQE
jgi:type I restriction enzyme M protein